MSDLMRIGSSAMRAAYSQLQTTGQNIANASTPGYVRREVVLEESGSMSNEGYMGRGVNVSNVRRAYDEFLVRESAAQRASSAQDAARNEGLQRMDRLFADPSAGLGATFDDLIAGFGDLTARPGDAATRSAVLARVDTFAQRASALDTRLVEMRDAAQDRMGNEVAKANDALKGLADINRRLADARGNGSAPNALLDQRDKLLTDLNGVMRANATVAQDGTVSVYSARGESLVIGGNSVRLQLTQGDPDPSRLGLSVIRPNGTVLPVSNTDLGGSLAGLMRFSTEDIEAARSKIGRLGAAVATALNDTQARGVDATGAQGRPLLAIGTPTVAGASTNTGNAQFTVGVTDGATLVDSDYDLDYDGVQYTLTRRSDGIQQQFSGLPQTVDGLEISDNGGAPAAGDRFLLRSATAFAGGLRALQNNPSRIAAALAVSAEAGSTNAGDLRAASLEVTGVTAATLQPVTVTFTSPTTFNLSGGGTGNPSGLPYTPGMTLSYNGWTATLDGAPAAGDTLRILPTSNPATDNRNARALQALGDARLVEGASVIDRYAELVGDVGTRAQSASASADMSKRLFEDAELSRNELSGVNLDEEAARLLQYQQAYQAAAKVIQTANEMFRSLLQAA
jgi:flagellar hook-associated protein 1 FlgK